MTNVLLIEDDPNLQRATKRMIHRALGETVGVDVAGAAPEAIAMLGSVSYDLVVSDFELVASTGGQVLDYLRTAQPAMVERFVFFSGSEEECHRVHDSRLVIEKGIWPAEFTKRLLSIFAEFAP